MTPTSRLTVKIVHRRTLKGQTEVVSGNWRITAQEARLLMLCNGYTPTDDLARIAAWHPAQAESIAEKLEREGLIEVVGGGH